MGRLWERNGKGMRKLSVMGKLSIIGTLWESYGKVMRK